MPAIKSTTMLYLPYFPVNKPPEMTLELKSKWYYDLGKLQKASMHWLVTHKELMPPVA